MARTDFRAKSLVLSSLLAVFANEALAENCLVQGTRKIGDCANVNVNNAKPLDVKQDGHFTGNFTAVRVRKGAMAFISGNVESVVVESGGTLDLTGNSGPIVVYGSATIDGNAGRITAHRGSFVTIKGIAEGVTGEGKIVKEPGSIVNGIYTK